MSTKGNQQTLAVRIPVAEEVGDTVTPLPSVKNMGLAPGPSPHPLTRSQSVPVSSTPFRLSRQSFRSATDGKEHPPPPPGSITGSEELVADQAWAREKDPFVPVETSHIRLKPDIRPASIAECDPITLTAARCANERLDKYMVIRQRSFHGLVRSKKERRTLPLTDPRDPRKKEETPSWVHRSKTDLYIEKRRAKIKSQQNEREKAINLNGMTFGSLVDHLPSTIPEHTHRRSFQNMPPGLSSSMPNMTMMTREVLEESRLPPLSLNKMKQMIKSDIETFKTDDSSNEEGMFRTSSLKTPRINSHGKGRLRKQPLTAIPLGIWEPSFDYVVVSNAKMLSPRMDSTASRTFPLQRDSRQQPSPLK